MDDPYLDPPSVGASEKLPYTRVFAVPEGDVPVYCLVEEYYAAAREIAEQLVNSSGELHAKRMPALFLFRHYLELTLKEIVFALRLLANGDTTKSFEHHFLDELWEETKQLFQTNIGAANWKALDVSFLNSCIVEFHEWDRDEQRFRYWMAKHKKNVKHEQWRELDVKWSVLPGVMTHAHEILREIYVQVVRKLPGP